MRKYIDQIKQTIKISSYIDKNSLISTGDGFKCLSPFTTEKTPSFFITEKDGIELFKDFSSGASGDIFSFLMKLEHKSFAEVYKDLLENIGIKPNFRKSKHSSYEELLNKLNAFFIENLRNNNIALDFLRNERNLRDEYINMFGFGLCNNGIVKFMSSSNLDLNMAADLGLVKKLETGTFKDVIYNRITIPLYNEYNNFVGFSSRKYLPNDEYSKYINPNNNILFKKNSFIYGLNLAKDSISENKFCIITEGYLDVIKLYMSGFDNTICVLGTQMYANQAKFIKKYTDTIYFCFDADAAGRASFVKNIKEAIRNEFNIKIIHLTDGMDPDEYIDKNGPDKFTYLIDNAKSLLDFIKESKDESVNVLEEVKAVVNKLDSKIKKQYWINNILESTGIDITKDINREYHISVIDEPFDLSDREIIKYLINTEDVEAKLLLYNSRLFGTEKGRLLFLKLYNNTYSVHLTDEEKNLLEELKLKKNYTKEEIEKWISQKEIKKKYE